MHLPELTNAQATLGVGFFAFLGTLIVAFYGHKKIRRRPMTQAQLLDKKVNDFMALQESDRQDLREELSSVKKDLEAMRQDNTNKDRQIKQLKIQVSNGQRRYNRLNARFTELKKQTDQAAAIKIIEDNKASGTIKP